MEPNRVLGAVAAIALTFACQLAAIQPSRAEGAAPERPNIVFILSDDEDVAIHAFAPETSRLVGREGAVFTNAFVTYPLCCPSRASILRGQYPHNTDILGNVEPFGGFRAFRRLGLEQQTVATWLQQAGYRTAFYGKYLNGYQETDPPPPGWTEWHAANGHGYDQFDYALNENGEAVAYGHAPQDYLTDVIATKAAAHIRQWSADDAPFFLYVAPFGIHSPYVPAPRHAGSEAATALPRPPNFDEDDVDDKPLPIAALPVLDESEIAIITGHYRLRREVLKSVDELVRTLIDALRESGELDDTYVVYASDNGFHLGLHRMLEGKDTAYEEDIRVPLEMRGPGIEAGTTIDRLVLNIDLAPTFLAMAGIDPPALIDGRSLMPLLRDPAAPWRAAFLIQRLGLESDTRLRFANALAVRTARHTFIAYADGEHELYDHQTDPFQLENAYPSAAAALKAELSERLIDLNSCRGAGCRRVEDRPIRNE